MNWTVVSTIESRAADAATLAEIAAATRQAIDAASYVAPRVTPEDERIWALVEAAAQD
jgi:hypothetical protein